MGNTPVKTTEKQSTAADNNTPYYLDHEGLMGGTPGETTVQQDIFEVIINCLHNVTDPNSPPANSLDHEDTNEKFTKILVEQLSPDWMRFAHIICLNGFYNIVEEIQNENKDNKLKLKTFLERINEINQSNFKEVIANCLYTLKRFDALLYVALNETLANMKYLIEHLSTDWKRFAIYACLYEVNCVITNIDQENNDDEKEKMKAFLEKLFDINPLKSKELIKSTLITMKKFSVLSALKDKQSIDDTEESCVLNNITDPSMPPAISLKHEEFYYFASDTLVLKDEQSIDNTQESSPLNSSLNHEDEQSIDDTQKGSALNNVTNPSVSPACFLNNEDEQINNIIQESSALNNVTDPSASQASSLNHGGMNTNIVSILKDKVASEWRIFARGTGFNDVDAVLDQISHDVNVDQKVDDHLARKKSKIENFLKKLYQRCPNDYIKCIQISLQAMGRNDVLQDIIFLKMCEALKEFYHKTYGKMNEIVHKVKTPTTVEVLNKFIKLTIVNSDEVEKDMLNILELKLFLEKQITYKPIEFNEVFLKEPSLLLLSGIAGIGKTCLLRKCLLDWASGTLWKNVDLVIYLECRELNQHHNISNINKLLNVFYDDIFQEIDVCKLFSVLFVIDGLDEFAYLDELINHNPRNPSKQPIVNTLAEALNSQKHKYVFAGRVGAVSRYKNKVKECTDKLNIQIMGFSDQGINEYIEKFGNKKEIIKRVLKESYYAKAMASVPFYLSTMCSIIAVTDSYSFCTMTELYCCIFLYFFQKHIRKTDEAVYCMMQSEINKQHVLKVCKVAWELFNQGKILFSQNEMKGIINDFDEVENELLGLIEKVESQQGFQYQFAHLTLMEYCASIYANIYLSPEEIISNKKLRSCLPMICGLANENKKCFIKFVADLKTSNENRNSLLKALLALVPKKEHYWEDENYKMFMECFFEVQGSMTEDLKSSIDKRKWTIVISDGKFPHEVSHEKYFMDKFIGAGLKLNSLCVYKRILSEDENNLLLMSLNNVCKVWLNHPVKIDRSTLKYKIGKLWINIKHILLLKEKFEVFVLPWIRLAEKELYLHLHEETDFMPDIRHWLRGSNFKTNMFLGNYLYDIEKLKKLK